MHVLEVPTNPKSPILFFGMPVLRFATVAVTVGLAHAAVSWVLFVLALGFGLGTDFGDGGKEFSKFLFAALRDWNFGYFLIWPMTHRQEVLGGYPVVVPVWSGLCGLFVGWLDAARRGRMQRSCTAPAEYRADAAS